MTRALVLALAAIATVAGSLAIIATSAGTPAVGGLSPSASLPPDEPEASYPPPMAVEDLFSAFATPGATATSYGETVILASTPAGAVTLPSGRLVAVDAMVIHGAEPLTLRIEPGPHPVSLLTADFESGDHRVAAAMLRVAEGEPVDWELALLPGQDPGRLQPGEVFGYGVDSGTGAFTSPEAIGVLDDEAAYQAYSDAVLATLYPDEGTIVDSAAVEVETASGANVVAFSSGFGDGVYATYLGRTADGHLVAVVTDFGVLDAPNP